MNFDFRDFCMTQAVLLRHFAKELLFWLVNERHFLKNSGLGIAGDRLESSLHLAGGLCTFS